MTNDPRIIRPRESFEEYEARLDVRHSLNADDYPPEGFQYPAVGTRVTLVEDYATGAVGDPILSSGVTGVVTGIRMPGQEGLDGYIGCVVQPDIETDVRQIPLLRKLGRAFHTAVNRKGEPVDWPYASGIVIPWSAASRVLEFSRVPAPEISERS